MRPWLEQAQTSFFFGYSWEFGGEAEKSIKANAAIGEQLPVGLLIIVSGGGAVQHKGDFANRSSSSMTIPVAIIGSLLVLMAFKGFVFRLVATANQGVISLAYRDQQCDCSAGSYPY